MIGVVSLWQVGSVYEELRTLSRRLSLARNRIGTPRYCSWWTDPQDSRQEL